MTVIFETGYTLPVGDEPLTHARVAHANNWYAGGTITASSTATGFFADAPDNSLTYEKWKPTGAGATWETDLGSAMEVDYCCIAAHDLGTTGNTLQVEYWDGAAWVGVNAGGAITDNSPIFSIFEPRTFQKWRIRNSTGTAPTIGVIRFGKALGIEQAIYGGHSPIDFNRVTTMKSNISATGEFVGRTKLRSELQTTFSWTHLTAAWVRTNWGVFQQAFETEPFFIAWRPGTFGEVGYVQTDSPATPSNMGVKSYMAVELTVRGPGYE